MNVPVGISIVIPIKYRFLTGMSKRENLYIPKLLCVSIPLYTETSAILPRYEPP